MINLDRQTGIARGAMSVCEILCVSVATYPCNLCRDLTLLGATDADTPSPLESLSAAARLVRMMF